MKIISHTVSYHNGGVGILELVLENNKKERLQLRASDLSAVLFMLKEYVCYYNTVEKVIYTKEDELIAGN